MWWDVILLTTKLWLRARAPGGWRRGVSPGWRVSEWLAWLASSLLPCVAQARGMEWAVLGCHWDLGPTFPRPNVHLRPLQASPAPFCNLHLEYFQLRFDALDTMWRMIRKPCFPADDNISSGWASFNSVPVPGAGEVSRRHTQTERLGLPGGRHSESE